MDKVNILYVNATPEHGGANILLINILKHLDLRRYHPIIVNPPQKVDKEADFYQFGASVFTIPIGVIKRSYNPFRVIGFLWETALGVRRLSALIKNERIQIVHTNSSVVISAAIAARLSGVPSLWHIHEFITPTYIRAILCRIILAFSDETIAISNTVRDQFPSAARSKVKVVYNGVDLQELAFRPRGAKARTKASLGFSSEAPLAGMIGRFTPWKGQECFIKACADVASEFPEARFVLAGQNFDELKSYVTGLERLAAELELSDRMCFQYWAKDIPGLINASDVLVHASFRPEGFGLVVVEAMAMGKPVIGTIGGVREIITTDVGLTVPARDHLAMSFAIKKLLADKEAARSMGEMGRRRVKRMFNIEKTADNFAVIYEDLLTETPSLAGTGLREAS